MVETLYLGENRMDFLVVGGIDKHLAVSEELQFLGHLLLAGEEILVVSLTDIGEDTNGGLDDFLQFIHLAGLGDTSLENRHVMLGAELPDGEGDTNLRVIAAGARHDTVVGRQKLLNPVLDDGLAIASCDAHHRNAELAAMIGGEALESLENVVDMPHVGLGQREIAVDRHNEVAHTLLIEALGIAGATVALGGNGKEKGADSLGERAAVGKQMKDTVIRTAQLCVDTPNDRGYFRSFHIKGLFFWNLFNDTVAYAAVETLAATAVTVLELQQSLRLGGIVRSDACGLELTDDGVFLSR